MPRDVIFWRLHFTLGAMGHAMNMEHMGCLVPDGMDFKIDTASMSEHFIDFVVNGLEAPA